MPKQADNSSIPKTGRAETGFVPVEGTLASAAGRKREHRWAALAVTLSIVLYVAAFPPFNVAESAYVFAVPLLLWMLRSPRWPLFSGAVFVWGVVSWLILIVWLRHVTLPGYVLLSVVLGLYFTLWWAAVRLFLPWARNGGFPVRMAAIAGAAALWVVFEYLRGYVLSGFPWLPLAASHWQKPLLLQISAWTGAFGTSFVLILFNLGLAFYADRWLRYWKEGWRRFCPEFFVVLAVLMLAVVFPYRWTRDLAGDREEIFTAGFVQPHIPQEMKWDENSAREILEVIERTTRMVAALPERPELLLWPEAVLPLPVKGNAFGRAWVEEISRSVEIPLLLGAIGVLRGNEDQWINGMFLVEPDTGLHPIHYAKRKLVPFGEYVPLARLWPWLEKIVPIEGSFARGTSVEPFPLSPRGEKIRLGTLICYEDVFARLARDAVLAGADVLVVATNNGWYGEEAMPYQHAAHSVLRAVETRRPVLRSGNGGWSGWIDEYGGIRGVLTDGEGSVFFRGGQSKVISLDSAWRNRFSFYTLHGDWFVLACAGVGLPWLLWGFLMIRHKRKS